MLHIDDEIREAEQELKHVGSCTTKGLTQEEIAQLDKRFFWAMKKLNWLRARRDLRVYVWKSKNTTNSQGNGHRKPSLEILRYRKPNKPI